MVIVNLFFFSGDIILLENLKVWWVMLYGVLPYLVLIFANRNFGHLLRAMAV